MTEIEGQDAPAVALGAGDYGGVDETEREVGVALDQGANAPEIAFWPAKR